MTRAAAETTTIARLRLTGDGIDDGVVQRGSAAIRVLDLQPPAMPPAAILCVRTLRDPLPRALDLRSRQTPRATRWEAAVRAALGDALRRAGRPARDAMPASADAVLFADRAELLACAARDACRREERWWWKHLLDDAVTPSSVAREWQRTPEAIPAAAELLVARGELAAFVRLMSAMLAAFALPGEAAAIMNTLTRNPIVLPRRRELIPPDVLHAPLQPVQRAFVVVAILLRRAPHLARRAGFAAEVLVVASEETVRPGIPDASPVGPVHAAVAEDAHVPAVEHAVEPEPCDFAPPPPAAPSPARTKRERVVGTGRSMLAEADTEPAAIPSDCIAPPPARTRGERVVDTGRSMLAEADTEPAAIPSDCIAPPPTRTRAKLVADTARSTFAEAATEPAAVVHRDVDLVSDHAGIYFFLNIAIALGFYSDFTSPTQHGLELHVDDFLALAGRRFAGEAFERDPLWRLLADPVRPRPDVLDEDAVVQPIIDALAGALAVDDPPRFLIARAGRVTITPVHLDVWFSLASHPIEIRRAGLDRDPGWMPAAGRHVAFHFD